MRPALLLCLALAPAARAQVIECPKFYPSGNTALAETPYRHAGQGFVARAQLRGAGMYTGEANGREELQGEVREVKGGWEARHGFAAGDRKWLVCSYGAGGDIIWWERIDPKVTRCTLQVHNAGSGNPMDAKATCK